MRNRTTLASIVVSAVVMGGLLACSSSSSTGTSGAALGATCAKDSDCASSSRGTVACFLGGQGGGVGDGGGGGGGMADGGDGGGTGANAGKSWCALKCPTPGPDTTLCGAPFDGTCNARGYCRLD